MERDSTVRNLSEALKEKKTSLVNMRSEMAQLKSEFADKHTETLQCSRRLFTAEREHANIRTKLQ